MTNSSLMATASADVTGATAPAAETGLAGSRLVTSFDKATAAIMSSSPRELLMSGSLSVLSVVIVWIAWIAANRIMARIFASLHENSNAEREAHLVRLEMALRKLFIFAALLIGVLVLLQIWGLNTIDILFGKVDLAGTLLRLFLIGAMTVLAWHGVKLVVSLLLPPQSPSGILLPTRSATVGPVLISTGRLITVTLAILLALSEIGLNITPLLAGAGIMGLAVGFGAQSLVKDFLTGIMILIEDTVGVGDVVTVAGHSGKVVAMNVRTIHLRDISGTLHVVPYSEIGTIENQTKDFGYALFDVGVAYDSDTDFVSTAIEETAADLAADEAWRDKLTEPIEIMGVNSFGDNAVVIRARIKTVAGEQWAVTREYNRRLKKRFDRDGIEIPFPQRTLHIRGAAQDAALLGGAGDTGAAD